MRHLSQWAQWYEEGICTAGELFAVALQAIPKLRVTKTIATMPESLREEYKAWLSALTPQSFHLSSNGAYPWPKEALASVFAWQRRNS
jgi:hypothetical protein